MLRRRFLAALMLAGTALPARAGAVTQDALPDCEKSGTLPGGGTFIVNGDTNIFENTHKLWSYWKKPLYDGGFFQIVLDMSEDYTGGSFQKVHGGSTLQFVYDMSAPKYAEAFAGEDHNATDYAMSSGRTRSDEFYNLMIPESLEGDTPTAAISRALLGGQRVEIVATTPNGRQVFTAPVQLPERDLRAIRQHIGGVAATAWADVNAGRCMFVSDYTPGLEAACYLTTASVGAVGLADDCWELRTLRGFRDGFLSTFEAGRRLVEDYYARAPRIVERISARPDGRAIWLKTYFGGILPSAIAARLGMNGLALGLYRRMTERLERLAA